MVVSGVEWLSNTSPLTNGGLGCRLGGVMDTGSLAAVTGTFWVGSEETLPGNSSKISIQNLIHKFMRNIINRQWSF